MLVFGGVDASKGLLAVYPSPAAFHSGAPPIANRLIDVRRLTLTEVRRRRCSAALAAGRRAAPPPTSLASE